MSSRRGDARVFGSGRNRLGRGLVQARDALAESLEGPWRRREPLPARPLVVVALALTAGVAAPLLVPLFSPLVSFGLAAVALVAWALSRRRATAAPLLLGAVTAAGAAWSGACWRWFPADELAWSLDGVARPVVVEGTVIEGLRSRPPATDALRGGGRPPVHECVVRVDRVRDDARWRAVEGKALVVLDQPPALEPGDRVRVWGNALRPPAAGNPGEFDRRARAREDRRLSVIRASGPGTVEPIGRAGGSLVARLLDRARRAGVEALDAHVSPRRSALAATLVLGARDGMPRESTESFMVTGTVHVLSISGLHVVLLATGLFALCRGLRLPHGASLAAVAVLTAAYMLLVGADTPALRATLLVWLGCLGGALGRRGGGLTALSAAAIAVLLWHPASLLRVGTQLSFLSTAVLVAATSAVAARRRVDDPIARLVDRSRSPLGRMAVRAGRSLAEATVVGAAVWLATAPLVAASFHLVSPVGLGLNLIVAPLIAVAMVGGFVCVLAAPASDLLAAAAGAVCDGALGLVEVAVGAAAVLPGAFAWVAGPPSWWVAGWYAIAGAMLLVLAAPRLVRVSTWAGAALGWGGVGLVAAAVGTAPDRVLDVTAGAMGHGCGVVVRGPGGGCLVYDAGRLGAGEVAGRGLSALLWSEGLGRIDTLVISHADTDHFNGVPDLLERFAVGRVVVPPEFLASPAPAVAEVLRLLDRAGVPVAVAAAGDEIDLDPLCRVRVLHPPIGGVVGDGRSDNETSLVVALEAAGRRVLLTGDLEGEALERFVAEGPGRCDVLFAPHHGSLAGFPMALARVTEPEWVVVSGAGGPRWPEVERAWATATPTPARVVRTDGAVRLRLRADSVAAERFRDGAWEPVGEGGDRDASGGHPGDTAANRPFGTLPAFAGGAPPAP